jgi:hypothetical protein
MRRSRLAPPLEVEVLADALELGAIGDERRVSPAERERLRPSRYRANATRLVTTRIAWLMTELDAKKGAKKGTRSRCWRHPRGDSGHQPAPHQIGGTGEFRSRRTVNRRPRCTQPSATVMSTALSTTLTL